MTILVSNFLVPEIWNINWNIAVDNGAVAKQTGQCHVKGLVDINGMFALRPAENSLQEIMHRVEVGPAVAAYPAGELC